MSDKNAAIQIIGNSYKLMLSHFPFLPYSKKLKFYKSYVEKLTESAYDIYHGQILASLPFSKKESVTLKNTETQLETLIKSIPRLKKYRGILRELISHHRKVYGLKD